MPLTCSHRPSRSIQGSVFRPKTVWYVRCRGSIHPHYCSFGLSRAMTVSVFSGRVIYKLIFRFFMHCWSAETPERRFKYRKRNVQRSHSKKDIYSFSLALLSAILHFNIRRWGCVCRYKKKIHSCEWKVGWVMLSSPRFVAAFKL